MSFQKYKNGACKQSDPFKNGGLLEFTLIIPLIFFKAAVCTSNLKKAQATLEGDLSNKVIMLIDRKVTIFTYYLFIYSQDAALDIDHNCHNLHGNSSGLELHGRIEHGGGEGDTVSWADRTRKNIIFSQSILICNNFFFFTKYSQHFKQLSKWNSEDHLIFRL